MKSDLNIMIDGMRLNIRVGIIFKYHDKVLIEIRKDREGNSVIPGGRMKIDESRVDTLKREIMEEMHYTLDDNKITYCDLIEMFYPFDGTVSHEFFFVYKYDMDEEIYNELNKIKENQDSNETEYMFVGDNEFDEVNLLPMELRDIIKRI